MTQTTTFPDWRKRAAAQLNDEDVEVAFMRQAFTHVESKASPLLKEPYFIGFEVVNKNDANTNMVGLFVFRVDKSLLYAPVFFKNGDVKGVNLLYDSRTKLFSPLVAEWCNYHVGRESEEGGAMISQGRNNVKGRGIDFSSMSAPESMRKSASEESIKAWEDMQKEASKSTKMLPKLLASERGTDAFEKLAHAVEKDFTFAQAMNSTYESDEWLDVNLGFKKKAAITEPGTLQIHIGEFNPNSEVPVDQQFAYGASFLDTRSTKAEIYEDREETGNEIGESGVYKVIDHSGDWKELLVIPNVQLTFPEDRGFADSSSYYSDVYKNPLSTNDLEEAGYNLKDGYNAHNKITVVIGIDEKKCAIINNKGLFGREIDKTIDDVTVAISELKAGDSVVLIDGCYVLSEPIKVTKVKKDENMTTIQAETEYGNKIDCVVNEEVKSHKSDIGVWSVKTRAFKLKAPEKDSGSKNSPATHLHSYYQHLDFVPGNITTISEFLCNNGVKRASIAKSAGRNRYTVKCNGQLTPELNKFATAAVLAHGMGIDGNSALELVCEAEEKGNRSFLVKSARISLDRPIPERIQSMNSEFGVVQEEPESYTISTDSSGPKHVESKIGDQYEMDGMQVIIETGTPSDLYEASKGIKDDTLFDMGVVGSLVKTFDGADLVEQYIPDLRQGLDKLGRILFLIYWKPEDFVDAYGSDDVNDLENKLLSSFKQFGDVVLDLMQQFKFEDKVDMNSMSGN